ncbi:unnamed protein product [Toxocara canis]|uniref:Reverse transcriptase n=1 Tax=Toxocara canis TaxID=6265 RepID=A0A183V0E2_TOXCA|nr:unnamed protein product [Toxocara canis]
MSMPDAVHFRGMKQILSELEPDTDVNSIIELKERTHMLCARFLGGAWKTVPVEQLRMNRVRFGTRDGIYMKILIYFL